MIPHVPRRRAAHARIVYLQQAQGLRDRQARLAHQPARPIEHQAQRLLCERAARVARRSRPQARLLRERRGEGAHGEDEVGRDDPVRERGRERGLVEDEPRGVAVGEEYWSEFRQLHSGS